MIYLKMSSAYKPEGGYEDILKIGYSLDSKTQEKRDTVYTTENPTIKTLCLIEGGTQQDERNLHKYFKKYLKYGNEWFECCDEILEFFRTHTTKKSLSEIPLNISKTVSTRVSVLRKKYRYFLLSIEEVLSFLDDRMLRELSFSDNFIEDSIMWLSKNYPDYTPMILQDYEDWLGFYNKNKSFIEKLVDTSIPYPKRLQSLCESDEVTKFEKMIIAFRVSDSFDRYYNILGPKKCKACSYNTDKLNKNISDMLISKDDIRDAILPVFEIGKRYKNADIKETLKKIYLDIGLKRKTAKANDLYEYFELKDIKIYNSALKKQEHGYEILSIKEQ